MAILLNPTIAVSVSIAADLLSFSFTDATGTYNATTNPGGYNTPNITSSSVTSAKIRVYTYGATVPYLFTFTILSNVVSALTVTAPDSTVTNIFADLTSTAFPFTGVSAFTIKNTYLGFASTQKITDQVYTFNYEIIGQYSNGPALITFDLNTTSYYLVSCNTHCCVKKMFVNLGCDCCSDDLQNALRAKAALLTAVYSADVGQYDAAQKAIDKAANLCSCAGCGC